MGEEEEKCFLAKEAELAQNIGNFWTCLILSALFAAAGLWFDRGTNLQAVLKLVPLIGVNFVALLLALASFMTWRLVERDRRLLTQLRALASNRAALEEPGVWPPPSNGPRG